MSFIINWWYGSSSTDASAVTKIYINELQERLEKECRAERAECRLDFSDEKQLSAFVDYAFRLQKIVDETESERVKNDYKSFMIQ